MKNKDDLELQFIGFLANLEDRNSIRDRSDSQKDLRRPVCPAFKTYLQNRIFRTQGNKKVSLN